MSRRLSVVVARWTAIVLVSIAIMFPPVWAISSWAVERAEARQRASQPKTPAQKDLGFGLRGLEALVIYTAGSFVVLWPLSLWASWRLLRGVGQKRREPVSAAAKTGQPGLVVTREQVLGESVPGADSAENRDHRPMVARPELPLDDAGARLFRDLR